MGYIKYTMCSFRRDYILDDALPNTGYRLPAYSPHTPVTYLELNSYPQQVGCFSTHYLNQTRGRVLSRGEKKS